MRLLKVVPFFSETCDKQQERKESIHIFHSITAIRSFSTDFIIAFFGGIGDGDDADATDSSLPPLLSANDLFRLLLVIALLEAPFLPDAVDCGGVDGVCFVCHLCCCCLFVDDAIEINE